jgi:hypothetical protein
MLIASVFVSSAFFLNPGAGETRAREELPWTATVLSICSEDSYYIGETINVTFNLTSGCQGISFNVSDGIENLAEEVCEIGSRPYANDSWTRGLWDLDRISSGKVQDNSMFNNTGGIHKLLCAPGPFHEGLDLSGTGSYVDVTSSSSLNISESSISIECWVNVSSTTAAKRMIIVDKESSYQLELQTNRELSWSLMTASQSWYAVDTNALLPADRWVYVAFTYDGAYGRTYIDGSEVHNLSYAKGPVKVSNLPLGIGAGKKSGTWSYVFQGMIDEVRVSNSTRTPSEIRASYLNYTLGEVWTYRFYLEERLEPRIYWVRTETTEGRPLPTVYIDVQEAVLGEPRNLGAYFGDRSIVLRWEPPAEGPTIPHLGYRLYRSTNVSDLALISEIGPEVVEYNDTSVINGVTYSYVLRSFNSLRETSGTVIAETPRTTPKAPMNLTARSYDASVSLLWVPVPDDGGSPVLGYRIVRSDSIDGTNHTFEVGPTSLSYDDGTVKNGIMYNYTVRAVNDVGESHPSMQVSALPMTIPQAPTGLRAIPGDKEVRLEWVFPHDNGGSVIVGFNIYRSHEEGAYSLAAMSPKSTWTDTGLINGDRYKYYLRSINDIGESSDSDEVSAVPMKLPGEPTYFSLARGNGYLNLSWSSPIDDGGSRIHSYRLLRASPDRRSNDTISIPGSSRFYNDTAVERGYTYEYSLRAVNGLGSSAPTATLIAVAMELPTEPSEMTLERGDGYVKLTWSHPMDKGGDANISYRLYRAVGAGGSSLIATLFGSRTYNDTGLENGRVYRYEVSSVNLIGESPLRRTVTTSPGTVPGIVKSFRTVSGDGFLLISWQPPSDDGGLPVLGYRIYRTEGGGAPVRIGEVDALTFKFNDTFLLSGIDYTYTVRAFNEMGEGQSPRPIAYSVQVAQLQERSSLPLSMSAAVFVLGLGLGTVIMFLLMRRKRREPLQTPTVYPIQEAVPEQVRTDMYNVLSQETFDPPEQVYADDLSPFSEPASADAVEPPVMDAEIDSLLQPTEQGSPEPTFADPPLEDPVMNEGGG